MRALPFLLLLSALLGGTAAASTPLVSLSVPHDNPIGMSTDYLQETGDRLTLDDAITAYHSGRFSAGHSRALTFGIGPQPAWLHFSVSNPTARSVQRQLSIETPWLDDVEVYFRHGDNTVASYAVGDRKAFQLRPVDSRYFAFEHRFAPGISDVFVRVATADPMVVPLYLLPLDRARAREKAQDYSYGFLYGFLFALLAYNLMLYAGLRHARYLLYSLYLGAFLLANLSYTGHGFQWIWPSHTGWAQWSNPVLMVLYGTAGLLFALSFLNTRRQFPRVHKAVMGYVGVSWALLLLAMALDSQRHALLVAFSFVFLFTGIMLAMGVRAMRSGQRSARYFLLAAVAAMLGAATTSLAVWGFIPFNTWTFRAVDIGMLLDATLLALALTYQFRIGQAERLRAEQLATLDPLTELNNRRAFYDKTAAIWNIALRHDHDLSVVLLDIDCFKRINDAYGHTYGDEVLVATAHALTNAIRQQDVLARWGGEEFILLLPETDQEEARSLAERLRTAIADMRLDGAGAQLRVSASFGVAQRTAQHRSLNTLISSADQHLYEAKASGRDRVCCAATAGRPSDTPRAVHP